MDVLFTENIKMRFYQLIYLLLFMLTISFGCYAQRSGGSSGLINIPAGELWPDKTFNAGVNYIPQGIYIKNFNYNTANYFFNVNFLPFIEVTYRLTLFNAEGKYNQQDRSLGGKCRILKEKKYFPSLVVGIDDIYTTVSGEGNQYFASAYLVSNKTITFPGHTFVLTIGYGFDPKDRDRLVGLFGGINYSPKRIPELELMAEYDTHHLNVAASVYLWKHLAIYGGWYGIKKPAIGIAYRVKLAD